MFYSGEEDEQDFLSPTGGSKLASLFGVNQSMSAGGNEKLTYTAPKEPKKKKPGDSSGSQPGNAPAVLHAEAVHAYKYVDGKYTSQGKLGAAILGNHDACDYKVLLYVTKQQQVGVVTVSPSFAYTVQANNYASFYDDTRQSWSVMFDNADKSVNFAKQIALAKVSSSGGSLESLVNQDLIFGEGGSLEVGDSAEVKYTGWLLKDHTFGQVFDSNANAEKLFRFKLGKGKVIKGWEEGMIGMKKSGRRLLIVPPSLAYGNQGMGNKVPSNSTLIFDIEVVRVKLSKERDSPLSSAAGSPSPSPVPTQQPDSSKTDDQTVKSRTKSISDQLEKSSKSEKAKLISRMAKMGKPMLPVSTGGSADHQESDEEEMQSYEPSPDVDHSRPGLPPKPSNLGPQQQFQPQPEFQPQTAPQAYTGQLQGQPMHQMPGQAMGQPMGLGQPMGVAPSLPHQHMTQQPVHPAVFQGVSLPAQMAVYQQPPQVMAQQQGYQLGMPYQQGPQYAPPQTGTPPPAASSTDTHLPVLMSETRQQNTEVRIAISKVSDKLDRVTEKLDNIERHGTGSSLALHGSSSPSMETAVLVHNIQRIVQDNERLKRELFEKSARIEAQNEKIADLLQRNQKYVEQSNQLLEQRNDSFKNTASASQARVLELEQEKVHLATELSTATARVSSLQLEVSGVKKRESELQQQLEGALGSGQTNREEFNLLKLKNAENEDKIEQVSSSLREEKSARKLFESQARSLEEELADLKAANANLEKALTDRKKKSAAEKKTLEEELDELKVQHEDEVTSLRNKLRKQKTSTDADTADKVAQIEAEMEKEWQEKCDRLVANAQEKHQRALKEVQEEKQVLQEKLKETEKKISSAKSSYSQQDKQVLELQDQLEEAKLWKDKYDNLRSQATTMKERYEDRLRELEEEKEQIEEEKRTAVERVKQLRSAGTPAGGSTNVAGEVKKVMNGVYRSLREEFDAQESYKGSQVQATILETIKDVTLKMTQAQAQEEDSEEEEDEDDQSEEDEDEVDEAEEKTASQGNVKFQEDTGGQEVVPKPLEKKNIVNTHSDAEKSQVQEKVQSKSVQSLSSTPNKNLLSQNTEVIEQDIDVHSGSSQEQHEEIEKYEETDNVSQPGGSQDTEVMEHDVMVHSGSSDEQHEEQEEIEKYEVTDNVSQPGGSQDTEVIEHDVVVHSGSSDEQHDEQEEIEKYEVTDNVSQPGGSQDTEVIEHDVVDHSGSSDKQHEEQEEIEKCEETEDVAQSDNVSSMQEIQVSKPVSPMVEAHADDQIENNNVELEQSGAEVGSPDENVDNSKSFTGKENEEFHDIQDIGEHTHYSFNAEPPSDGNHENGVEKQVKEVTNSASEDQLAGNSQLTVTPESIIKIPTNDAEELLPEANNLEAGQVSLSEDTNVKDQLNKESVEQQVKSETLSDEGLTEIVQIQDSIAPNEGHGIAEAAGEKINIKSAQDTDVIESTGEILNTKGFDEEISTAQHDMQDNPEMDAQDWLEEEMKAQETTPDNAYNDVEDTVEPEVMAKTSSGVLEAKPKEKAGKGDADGAADKVLLDAVIRMQQAAVTGDKGNPYYAAELDQGKETKEKAPKDSVGTNPLQAIIQLQEAAITGDKGNPYYKEELDQAAKGGKKDVTEHKEKDVKNDDKVKKDEKPKKMDNPVKESKKEQKGKESKKDEKAEVPVEAVMVAQSASTVSAAVPGKSKDEKDKGKDKDSISNEAQADILKKLQANVTGDKGNPYYAAELDASGSEKVSEKDKLEILKKMQANVTGDKGNPYYAAELDGKDLGKDTKDKDGKEAEKPKPVDPKVLESVIAASIIPDAKGKDGKNIKEGKTDPSVLESMIASSIIPDKDSSGQSSTSKADALSTLGAYLDTGGSIDMTPSKDNKPPHKDNGASKEMKEDVMEAKSISQTTSGKGVPKSKKGVSKTTKATSKDSKQSLEDRLAASIIPGVLEPSGGKDNKDSDKISSSDKNKKQESLQKLDSKASSGTVPVTGDKGNPHYLAELKKSETKKMEKDPVASGKTPVTGGKGNPFYEEELKKGKTDSKQKEKDKSQKADSSKDTKAKEKDAKSASSALEDILSDPLFKQSPSSKDTDKKKEAEKKQASASPLNRNPPPLFDDDKPLFGEDDNVEDTFGLPAAKGKDSTKKDDKQNAKKEEKKKSQTPSKKANKKFEDPDDDLRPKPPPPPLFGDDEDDDDLDWLS